MHCSSCGTENRLGRRFCANCGAALGVACANCGAENEPGDRFCGECGGPLAAAGVGSSAPAGGSGTVTAPSGATVSERRLVSVLFADLVGFTTLAEHRDPEEVRDLLSQYFDRCRSLIERYGGTVEKFIGDAVMAVWGTPVAREDDAERAVRAALSLTSAVTLLGEEVGMPTLRVRAGVLTGNASVEVGAEGEGMVLGDTVNTASRLQSIAAPGTVLVDDVTRRSSEAAIEYEDAGEHPVKGREQPVRAWTALRVVAGAGGNRRAAGLEAPFVGRERELQRVIESAETSANEGQARLVAIVGEAGAGKSRLLWEYEKYLDGVQRVVRWHRGRCPSYGEGVAYWALAEMVRSRAGIVEEEDPATARRKLSEAVVQHVPDERERRLVEPRLAHLLGLEQRTAADRADLFSGWRLFFERMSDESPVVLVFEDLQWAASGLLEFIDYLLEWSADRRLFILALGRPELLDERPDWRDRAIVLDRLPDETMHHVLSGLVPGLPDDLTRRILDRAEGVPLYAIETVRMLLDRGLLTQEGLRYVVTGEISELDVPETLQALAAARLDGLTPTERAVLQDAAVLGHSFTTAGVVALGNRSPDDATRLLKALVGKQLIALNDDPLSSERGQYYFLQGLLRTTAYGTLSRRDRKARHLAAARHLQESSGEGTPEIAEVLAAHFLDAAAADPEAADADRIRAAACETLEDAGRRALSLALPDEAQRAFDRAAELAQDEHRRAVLIEQAGNAAMLNNDLGSARARLEQAIAGFEALGDRQGAARTGVALASAAFRSDRTDETIAMLQSALENLPDGTPDRALALGALARSLSYAERFDEALVAADDCLAIAEPQQIWAAILTAYHARAMTRRAQGRLEEVRALFERCLDIALDHDLTSDAVSACNNVADTWMQADDYPRALEVAERGRGLAQARGDRLWEGYLAVMIATLRTAMGTWDEVNLPPPESVGILSNPVYICRLRIAAARGDLDELRTGLAELDAGPEHKMAEFAGGAATARVIALRALGDDRRALDVGLPPALAANTINEDRRELVPEVGLAALALDEESAVEQLIACIDAMAPASRSPTLRSTAARLAGLLALRRGDAEAADERLHAAARALDGIVAPFPLGQVLVERAEVLAELGRAEESAATVAEAIAIFERLQAAPWLDRARSVAALSATA